MTQAIPNISIDLLGTPITRVKKLDLSNNIASIKPEDVKIFATVDMHGADGKRQILLADSSGESPKLAQLKEDGSGYEVADLSVVANKTKLQPILSAFYEKAIFPFVARLGFTGAKQSQQIAINKPTIA